MMDEPTGDALVEVVAAFLRKEVMPRLEGQLAFDARVAANALELVVREMRLGPEAARAEHERLVDLLQQEGAIESLNRILCERIRSGVTSLAAPGVLAHLRATSLDKIAIDQPGYATAVQIRESGWDAVVEEPWPVGSAPKEETS